MVTAIQLILQYDIDMQVPIVKQQSTKKSDSVSFRARS